MAERDPFADAADPFADEHDPFADKPAAPHDPHELSPDVATAVSGVAPETKLPAGENFRNSIATINETLNPFSAENAERVKRRSMNPLDDWSRVPRGLGAVASAVIGPIMEPVNEVIHGGANLLAKGESYLGRPLARLASHLSGKPVSEEELEKQRQEVEEKLTEGNETALGLAMPTRRALALASANSPLYQGARRAGVAPIKALEKHLPEQVGITPDGTVFDASAPPKPTTGGPSRLSKGQYTGDLSTIQQEQAALDGHYGPRAQREAQAFFDAQAEEMSAHKSDVAAGLDSAGETRATVPQHAGAAIQDELQARERTRQAEIDADLMRLRPGPQMHPVDAAETVAREIRGSAEGTTAALQDELEGLRRSMHPQGTVIANTPQEAADVISGAVTRAEEQAREVRDAAYDRVRNATGTFEPEPFTKLGQNIERTLRAGDEPVMLNSTTTPMAIAARDDLDGSLGAAARKAADPATKAYTPFTPSVVDDARKRLVAWERQAIETARSTGVYSDVRAIRAVREAFDDIVERALENNFSGDGRDVAAAMRDARALHGELRSTFTKQGGADKVGQTMQEIIGRMPGQATSPTGLATALYGNGEKPVLLGRRLVGLFGSTSPEVAAIKQGWLSHIMERPEGMTVWTPDKVADRIYDAIRGKGSSLADVYLTPGDRQRWLAYADRLRAAPRAIDSAITKALPRTADSHAPLADTLFGKNGTGDNPLGVKIAKHVMDTYGLQSEAGQALRQGQFGKLVRTEAGRAAFDAEEAANNIDEFLDGKGNDMANTLYSPREQQMLREYSKDLRDYAKRTAVSKDPIEQALDKIIGRNGHYPASPLEVAEMVMGAASKVKDKWKAIELAKRLKGMLGENSEQWGAMRQALFHHLDQGGPQAAVHAFDDFFGKHGIDIAKEFWRPQDIDAIKKYVDWKRKLVVPPDGKNYSRTSTFQQKVAKYIGNRLADLIGAGIGSITGTIIGGPVGAGIGFVAGHTVTHAMGAMNEASMARRIARDLPALGEQMRRWQKAVARLDRMNSGPNRVAAAAATAQLSRSLHPFGINLPIFAGTGPSTAEEKKDENDVERPGTKKAHGGAVDKHRHFPHRAHGGSVSDSRHVALSDG